jgi:hypothetical protein
LRLDLELGQQPPLEDADVGIWDGLVSVVDKGVQEVCVVSFDAEEWLIT